MNASKTALGFPALAILACVGLSAPAHAAPATDLNCKGCVDKKDIGKNQVDGKRIKDGSIRPEDLHKSAQPTGVSRAEASGGFEVGSGYEAAYGVSIIAPGPGYATVIATWVFQGQAVNAIERCNLSLTEGVDEEPFTYTDADQNADYWVPAVLMRTFDVPAGPTTFYLNCNDFGTNMRFVDPSMTAIFSPQSYASPH